MMLKVLFIDQYGKNMTKEIPCIPSVGDKVTWFYDPVPSVTGVLWFPESVDADVIITLGD